MFFLPFCVLSLLSIEGVGAWVFESFPHFSPSAGESVLSSAGRELSQIERNKNWGTENTGDTNWGDGSKPEDSYKPPPDPALDAFVKYRPIQEQPDIQLLEDLDLFPPDKSGDSGQTKYDNIPISDLFSEFIRHLRESDDPSTRALAEKYNNKLASEKENEWLASWKYIKDDFSQNTNRNSKDFEDGMQYIDRAIHVGEHPVEYSCRLDGNSSELQLIRVTNASTNNVEEIINAFWDKGILIRFIQSGQFQQILLNSEFCLDFPQGQLRSEYDGRIITYNLTSSWYQNSNQSTSKYFIDLIENSQNERVRKLTGKFSEQLKCIDPQAKKDWLIIWENIEIDFDEIYMESNSTEENQSMEAIENLIQESQLENRLPRLAQNGTVITISIEPQLLATNINQEQSSTTFFNKPTQSPSQNGYNGYHKLDSGSGTSQSGYSDNGPPYVIIFGFPPVLAVLIITYILYKRHISLSFNLHIDFSRFTIMQQLGSGNFAQVYLVDYRPEMSWRMTSCLANVCAVKVKAAAKLLVPQILGLDHQVEPSVFAGSLRCYVDEIKIRKLNHRNIVRIYGLCTNFYIAPTVTNGATREIQRCTTMATIFEYMDMGDLGNYLQKYCSLSKSPEMAPRYFQTLYSILIDITEAFLYLKSQKIVHRDLAARNVLLKSKSSKNPYAVRAKVADFGLAKLATTKGMVNNEVCWSHYGKEGELLDHQIMAPESRGQFLYTSLSDVYAFGVLMIESIVLMEKKPDSSILNIQTRQDNGYARVVQENEVELVKLENTNSTTIYSPVQTVLNMEQNTDVPVQNTTGESCSDNTTLCEMPARPDAQIQKTIDQLKELANACLKKKMDERITFVELLVMLLSLRK